MATIISIIIYKYDSCRHIHNDKELGNGDDNVANLVKDN